MHFKERVLVLDFWETSQEVDKDETFLCRLQWQIQGAHPARAPEGARFFRFDIQILRNSRVGSWHPIYEVGAPYGNAGSATGVHINGSASMRWNIISVYQLKT